MNFYLIPLICFLLIILSFLFMTNEHGKMYLPRKWSNKFYSNSKLALLINCKKKNNRRYKEFKIDLFREIPFWLFVFLFFIGLTVFFIDLFTNFSISAYLGDFVIKMVCACLFMPYIFYVFTIIIVWSIFNKNDYKGFRKADINVLSSLKGSQSKQKKDKDAKH